MLYLLSSSSLPIARTEWKEKKSLEYQRLVQLLNNVPKKGTFGGDQLFWKFGEGKTVHGVRRTFWSCFMMSQTTNPLSLVFIYLDHQGAVQGL